MSPQAIDAVQQVIRAQGFDNLALEFATRPKDRAQIVHMVARDMERHKQPDRARKFRELVRRLTA